MTVPQHRQFGPLALLCLTLFGLLRAAVPPAGTDRTASTEPTALDELQAWQKALQQQPDEPAPPAIAAMAAEEPAPEPATFLADLAGQVRADRQALAEIKRWQANWPEPDGHAEELVLQARACAIERRNLRKLHDALAELDRSLDTWEAIRQRRADERLHRLGQIIPWIQDEETEPKAVAELTSWRDELRRQTDDTAPPAKPDADPRAELKRLRAELAKLLTASARACDGVETDVGKGRTETLVHTAGLYPQERQRREQVQTDMENFLAQLTVWLGSAGSTPGADLRRVERILRLATAEEPTATVAPAAKPVTDVTAPADPESFEYYQLPKDQTLKEISALPTIYGDPAKWNRLLEANREAVPSPEAALPSGTLLVIPRTPQTKPATN